MSSAFYPLGMNSYNNRLRTGGYESWKGRGIYGNPVGITSGNMRPLTNNDPANDAVYKFGLPRPIKQYRRGIAVPIGTNNPLGEDPAEIYKDINQYYYSNRQVKSSIRGNMISQLIDNPGGFIVKDNSILNPNEDKFANDCKNCKGIGLVSGWYPINNLTEKPQPNVTNPLLCCNQQRKAIRRVLPASTLLKKNYYTTTYQYLFNRCQTFDQRSFNFVRGVKDPQIYKVAEEYPFITEEAIQNAKPGSPLAYSNLYVANCNPNGEISTAADLEIIQRISYLLFFKNIITEEQYKHLQELQFEKIPLFLNFLKSLPPSQTEAALILATEILYNPYDGSLISGPSNPKGCKLVEYKPNNPQFAKQGAVSSSTRILKLNVTTIEKNAALNKKAQGAALITDLSVNTPPFIPFIYKNKAPKCNPGIYIKNGNPKTCFKNTDDIANSKYQPAYSFNSVVNQLSDMTSIVNR